MEHNNLIIVRRSAMQLPGCLPDSVIRVAQLGRVTARVTTWWSVEWPFVANDQALSPYRRENTRRLMK